MFRLPWFTPSTTHGQNFNCFLRLCLALFPHDVSYISKVVKHIFSPAGLFQYSPALNDFRCLVQGEQRPSLADLLWERAQQIISDYLVSAFSQEEAKDTEILPRAVVDQLQAVIKEVKTVDELLARAKVLLRKYSDQGAPARVEEDLLDLLFLKLIFSFHPTK